MLEGRRCLRRQSTICLPASSLPKRGRHRVGIVDLVLASTASDAGGTSARRRWRPWASSWPFCSSCSSSPGGRPGRIEKPLVITLVCLGPAVLLVVAGLVIPAHPDGPAQLQEPADPRRAGVSAASDRRASHARSSSGWTTTVRLHRQLHAAHAAAHRRLADHRAAGDAWPWACCSRCSMDRMKHAGPAQDAHLPADGDLLVGASLIWSYVYNAPVYNNNGTPGAQTGLLSRDAI